MRLAKDGLVYFEKLLSIAGGKPGREIDQSVYGDDTETPYDVSLNFVVTRAELNTVVNTLINQQAYNYDLNNFNCTNAAMEALKSININLPSTKASEALFYGNDPGDLGQDIRNLNLDNFGAANGNRKITRTVSSSNNQQSPAKKRWLLIHLKRNDEKKK